MRGLARVVPALLAAYGLARRKGLLERRWFRSIYVRAYFAYKRHLEDPFDGLVRARAGLFAGGHVLDVGAHIGYTAATFFRALDPGFRVYAFEPDAANLALLRETLRAEISQGRVVPVAAAVGAAPGRVSLLRNPTHSGDHRVETPAFREGAGREAVEVPLLSLDSFLGSQGDPGPIAFVKVDVQGYEPEVCRGMERTLERSPDAVVAIEYSEREIRAMGFEPASVPAFFRERGFRLHLLRRDGRCEPWDEARVAAALAARAYVNLLCARRELGK